MGWIQRSKDGNRQKIENRIRTQWIDKYYDVGDKVSTNPNEENLAKLKELAKTIFKGCSHKEADQLHP
jgi:hypothetical protein